jgi:hypothetical protein
LRNPRLSRIPKILTSAQPTGNERLDRSKSLKKYRVVAKAPEFRSKCNRGMTTRFHLKKGRAAARTTPGETAVCLGRNEVGNDATRFCNRLGGSKCRNFELPSVADITEFLPGFQD